MSRKKITTPSAEALQQLRNTPITAVMLSGRDMLAILGALQLSLRHPRHVGPSSQIARAFADELEKRIVQASPELKDLCAAGWDPAYDE